MKPLHPSIAYAAGISAVLLWSTAVVVAAKMSTLGVRYSVVAFVPVVLGWLALTIVALFAPKRLWNSIKNFMTVERVALLLIGGLSLAVYEVCFWYSLVLGPRLEANAINYLWPIMQVVFTLAFFRLPGNRVYKIEFLLLVTSYIGALLIVVRPDQVSWGFLTGDARYLLVALVGAAAVGLHFAAARFSRKYASDDPLFHSIAWNFIAWPITAAFLAIFFWFSSQPFLSIATPNEFAWIAWEGLIVFGLGYLLYIFSIQQYPSISLSGIAYLTPVFGSIWLVLLFSEKVTLSIVVGLLLIVISNIVMHSRFRHLNPAIAAAAVWGISLSYCLVVPGMGKSNLLDALSGIGAVMGILIGFALSRLASAGRDQTKKYLGLFRSARDLIDIVDLPENKQLVEADCMTFLRCCTDYFFAGARGDRFDLSSAVRQHFRSLRNRVRDCSGDESKAILERLEADLDEWLVLKTERMPAIEWLALGGLGLFFAITFAVFRENNAGGDLAALLVSGGTAFLFATLRDLDIDRPSIGAERMALVLDAYRKSGTKPYLPAHLASNEDFVLWSLKTPTDVTTIDELGQPIEKVIYPPSVVERIFFLCSLVAVFMAGFSAIAYKHLTTP